MSSISNDPSTDNANQPIDDGMTADGDGHLERSGHELESYRAFLNSLPAFGGEHEPWPAASRGDKGYLRAQRMYDGQDEREGMGR
jgi:hypothetical protein